ncbi:osteocrin [Larimichthys crocea]|uniref:osteocrin n=1 Tax=Larimichthys crocea TaxID=215358 RepID=UPI000901C0FD|nr:osteocrin [Larimichthys crocea]
MHFSGCLVISCFLSVALLSGDAFRVQPAQCVDRPVSRSLAGLRPRPRGVKTGEELTAKLLRLDELVRMENDVMEPKRKRSFPGNNGPLDRLTVNSMETKQATSKQSKVVELPRRRVNPPPVDRIGMSRLPNSRG